ncbi:MAG TPA: M1 family metallopeptidase [Rhodothermales bacterium]|nr:M1 family metallopeptidase [Rhodothermales bacterium]
MKKIFWIWLVWPTIILAQTGEWQQKVVYEMDIQVLANKHQLKGFQRLTYTNNSPDTLQIVYYHLYFNAFQPQSMMAERNRHLPDPDGRVVPRIFNLKENEIGWHKVEALRQDGVPLAFEVYDTVMKVKLDKAILPGQSTVFEMNFRSQIPLQTRRSGRDSNEGVDFSMSQWYPKMANYDQRGWYARPYIGREFYAPFGTFDVKISMPKAYVLGGTGVVQNPDEVGHGYGAKQAFGDTLKWHFKAENVHDFAWVADTDYAHDTAITSGGKKIHILYLKQNVQAWGGMKEVAPKILDKLSELFGDYGYPQFTIAQAGDGGMEYPMIIFITGSRGSLQSLLGVTIHEGAHEWFYGMMGSNEMDYAWMDEGFTSYATTEVAGKLLRNQIDPSHAGAFGGILMARKYGFYEPLSTPSDWFATNSGYSTAAYSGGQMIAEMLGYVISPELRDKWFLEYYKKFRFRHPEPHDLELLAEKVSGLQLDWFFDQWTLRNWKNDYTISKLSYNKTEKGYETVIKLKRLGRAAMPIDLQFVLEDGSNQWVNIPLSEMMGHKPVPSEWKVLPAWGWTSPEYTVTIALPQKPLYAEIDPFGLMLDENRLNNISKGKYAYVTKFMNPLQNYSNRYSRVWSLYPAYNSRMGIGFGAQIKGIAPFGDDLLNTQMTLYPILGSYDYQINNLSDALALLNYDFLYEKELGERVGDWRAKLSFDSDQGIVEDRLFVTRNLTPSWDRNKPKRILSVGFTHNDRIIENAYPNKGYIWSDKNVLSGMVLYRVSRGDKLIEALVEFGGASIDKPQFLSDYNSANRFSVKAQRRLLTGKQKSVLARVQAGIGVRNLAPQKRFIAGSPDLENQWRSDAYRTLSSLSAITEVKAFSGVGPVSYGIGGPNEGYYILAGSLLWELTPKFKPALLAPLTANVFAGMATVGDGLLGDAGLALNYNLVSLASLQRWVGQSDVLAGMNLSLKFPFFVTMPRHVDGKNRFAFRYLFGVEHAF